MGLELASFRAFTLSISLGPTGQSSSEAYWGEGYAALVFGPDWIRTLVFMATDSSHRVIMGENLVTTLAPSYLIGSSLFLQVTRTTKSSWMGLKFGKIQPGTYELAALERLEKSP